MLHVRTTSAPVDGQANKSLVEQIAKALRVPKSSVTVVRGHKSRDKVLSFETLAAPELAQRLAVL